MLLKRLLTQNIGKRILLYFFLFSFIITAISIAAILYTQYKQEKVEIVTTTRSLVDSRVEFIGEVLWNLDKPLAELSIKSLADNPSITYIALYNENKELFTAVGNESITFEKAEEIPLFRDDQQSDKKLEIGSLVVNISTVSAEQHVKDSFVNILLVQTLKSFITSFVFLFLIYQLLIKHLNRITKGIITNSKIDAKNNDLIELKRKPRYDELQLLAETLNKNKLARNKHLKTLKAGKNKLIKEIGIRKAAEKKATNSHKELLYVLNSLTTAVFYCKGDGEVLFMNHKALNLLSQHDAILSATGEIPQYINHIVRFNEGNDIATETLDMNSHARNSNFISSFNAYHVSNDGLELLTPVELTVIPTTQGSDSRNLNFIIVVKDKSEEAKLKEMSYLVQHDYLTKIHNRMYLTEQMEVVLAEGPETSGGYCLALIELDNFKAVNDIAGHQAGDQFLKLVVEAISKSVGQNDLFARMGGVEFAILFNLSEEDSVQKSFKIINDIERVNSTFNDELLRMSCTIGITKLRESDRSTETVIARVDKAGYRAKRNGKGTVLTDRDEVAYIPPAQMAL